MDPNYPAIVGFTEKELSDYFGNHIKKVATTRRIEMRAMLEEMKYHQNGFQFSSAGVHVYNPCSIISYLQSNGNKTTTWNETGESGSFLNKK